MSYRITGKLLRPYQRDIIRPSITNQKKHLLLIAPRRSGKSFMNCYMVNALTNKIYLETGMPINSTIFAPQQKQCREIYIDNILTDGRKLPSICNGRLIQSRLTIEYPFGSKIKFTGSDNIDSKVGAGNKIIVLDEYTISKPEAFQYVYPMIHSTDGHMIVSSTPRGRNHLYDLYERTLNDPKWLVVKTDVIQLGLMTWDEYHALPMEENYKRQEFLCDWDASFLNAVYATPNLTTRDYTPGYQLYAGIDLGMQDFMAIVFAQWIDEKVYIIGDVECNNTPLQELTANHILPFLQKYNLTYSNLKMFVPHDCSQVDMITGDGRRAYLQNLGIDCETVSTRNLMEAIDKIRSQWHTIFFNQDNSKRAIERIKSYVNDQRTHTPKHDDSSHMADALRELILGLIKNTKLITDVIQYESYYNF